MKKLVLRLVVTAFLSLPSLSFATSLMVWDGGTTSAGAAMHLVCPSNGPGGYITWNGLVGYAGATASFKCYVNAHWTDERYTISGECPSGTVISAYNGDGYNCVAGTDPCPAGKDSNYGKSFVLSAVTEPQGFSSVACFNGCEYATGDSIGIYREDGLMEWLKEVGARKGRPCQGSPAVTLCSYCTGPAGEPDDGKIECPSDSIRITNEYGFFCALRSALDEIPVGASAVAHTGDGTPIDPTGGGGALLSTSCDTNGNCSSTIAPNTGPPTVNVQFPSDYARTGEASVAAGVITSKLESLLGGGFGTVDNVDLQTKSVNVAITPVSVSDSGLCPAPAPMVLHGQMYFFDWTTYCNYATGIKPVLLAFAWLAAAGILIGGFREA